MTKRLRISDECSEAMDRLNDEAKKNNQIPEVRAASVFHNRWQRPWQHCTRLLRLQRAVKDGLVPAAGVLVMKEDGKSSKTKKVLPDFNSLKESQQFFLRRRKLVGKIRGAEHAQGQAAKSQSEKANNKQPKSG